MWDKHVRYHPDQTKWPTKRTFEVSPSCEVMRRKVVLHSSQYDNYHGINAMIMMIMIILMIMIIMMRACDDQVWCFFAATPANSVSVWGGDGGKTSGNQHKPRWNTLKRKTLFWKGSLLEIPGTYKDFFLLLGSLFIFSVMAKFTRIMST